MTVLAWLRGAWAWLASRPIVTGAMLLVGVIFSQRVYIAALRRKMAKSQADADRAAVALVLARQDAERKKAREALEASDEAADEAAMNARVAGDGAKQAAEKGKEIDGRWPLPAILLLVALSGTPARAEGPPPCVPETPSALTDAMRVTAAKLTGMDRLAVEDGAARIDAYRQERAELCLEVAALTAQVAALTRSRELVQAIATLAKEDTETMRQAWEAALAKPALPGRSAFGFLLGACLSYPITAESDDGLALTASGCWGWRP